MASSVTYNTGLVVSENYSKFLKRTSVEGKSELDFYKHRTKAKAARAASVVFFFFIPLAIFLCKKADEYEQKMHVIFDNFKEQFQKDFARDFSLTVITDLGEYKKVSLEDLLIFFKNNHFSTKKQFALIASLSQAGSAINFHQYATTHKDVYKTFLPKHTVVSDIVLDFRKGRTLIEIEMTTDIQDMNRIDPHDKNTYLTVKKYFNSLQINFKDNNILFHRRLMPL